MKEQEIRRFVYQLCQSQSCVPYVDNVAYDSIVRCVTSSLVQEAVAITGFDLYDNHIFDDDRSVDVL